MATYIIGREPDPDKPRIVIEDRTVSRKHGTLSASGGAYILSDSNSTGGTFIREPGGWRRITSASVLPDDEIRLGMFVTTIQELLQRAVRTPTALTRQRVERDPETGEIVKKAR
ncbi:MAG TPA: FHA domain-containing protein [Microvirga sp.]|nr:FHA domain-containing protein [Microvirga sp.]